MKHTLLIARDNNFFLDSETEVKTISYSPVGENTDKKNFPNTRSHFKSHHHASSKIERPFLDLQGNPVSQEIVESLMHFRRKQPAGNIDVWWLYDDGGK